MKSKLKVVELELQEKGITVCPRVGVTVTIEGKAPGDGGFWVVLELSPWVIVSLYSVKFLFFF